MRHNLHGPGVLKDKNFTVKTDVRQNAKTKVNVYYD